MEHYLGIDVSLELSSVCVVRPSSKSGGTQVVGTGLVRRVHSPVALTMLRRKEWHIHPLGAADISNTVPFGADPITTDVSDGAAR